MSENPSETPKPYALGVDIGGTKIAVAAVGRDGAVVHKRKTAVAQGAVTATADQILELIETVLERSSLTWSDIAGVGVCIPGIYFAADATVWAPNVWGDQRVALGDVLRQRISADVVIDSDRAAYVLGEQWLGAAQGLSDVVFMAVGTGIGAGIISGGRLCRGSSDIAGAVGWFAVGPRRNEPDRTTGALEFHAAGPAVARRATERIATGEFSSLRERDITTEVVVRSALEGDAVAASVLDETASYLGMGIANIISILNPQVVVLGGGLMNAGDYLLEKIRDEVLLWAQPLAAQQCRIELTRLGDDAGLTGAARLVFLAENNQGGTKNVCQTIL